MLTEYHNRKENSLLHREVVGNSEGIVTGNRLGKSEESFDGGKVMGESEGSLDGNNKVGTMSEESTQSD